MMSAGPARGGPKCTFHRPVDLAKENFAAPFHKFYDHTNLVDLHLDSTGVLMYSTNEQQYT